jgi:hypothetical protein
MKNGHTLVGLFQGMFTGNILTFHPGWDESGKPVDAFEDIRNIKAALASQGIAVSQFTEPTPAGPASFFIIDSDHNMILLDQHR